MNELRRLATDYGLFLTLLIGSGAGHFALAHAGQQNTIHIQLYDREHGRTSIAIQLIAASPTRSELMAEAIKDVKKPLFETEKQTSLKPLDLPLERTKSPLEEIVAAVQPRPDAPVVPKRTTPTLERMERQDKLEPPAPAKVQAKPAKKRLAEAKLPELETIDVESAVTVLTKQSAGVDTPARYLTRVDPEYPPDLHRRRIQGVVHVAVTISVDGQPKTVRIHESSGHPAMDDSALACVRQWKFQPKTLDGIPVETEAIAPIYFSIGNSRIGAR